MSIVIHNREKLKEYVLEHPFEVGLSIALIAFGLKALISKLSSAPDSVQSLPLILAIAYCVLSVLGGGAVLFGKFARVKWLWAYGVERFGFFVSASAWASYIVGLAMSDHAGKASLTMFVLGVLSIASLIKTYVINRKAKATMYGLQIARKKSEETP